VRREFFSTMQYVEIGHGSDQRLDKTASRFSAFALSLRLNELLFSSI
jgi:hypothetical protein